MRERARLHRLERSGEFTTFEEPLNLGRVVTELSPRYRVIVIDCLTLWLSNLMQAARHVETELNRFLIAGTECAATVFTVTNEVGCGIVPDNELSRRFRDEAGRLNQRVAAVASEVYWMAFGLSLRMK